jgi:murein DD-endopeptidase MepM/ murein hydrolase activator NlpD
MGRRRRPGHNSTKKRRPLVQSLPTNRTTAVALDRNFVPHAGPGCHIARFDDNDDDDTTNNKPWVLEWERVDPADYHGQEIPDLAIDNNNNNNNNTHEELKTHTTTTTTTLTLCNIRPTDHVVAYISVYETVLRDCHGKVLQQGSTTDDRGKTRTVTTLIVLCPPLTFCHLCYIDLMPAGCDDVDDDQINKSRRDTNNATVVGVPKLEDLQIDSDVQVWRQHPNPSDTHNLTIGFPLATTLTGPVLCTQGEGGQLTHFFAGNLHAIDFQCPVGTPLLAVANGVVVETKVAHQLVTGISVHNLFEWNSILIRVNNDEPLDTGGSCIQENKHSNAIARNGRLYVEYVHIQSATVQAGDHVTRGQVIGTTGSVGFSPEPHLHLAAYRSAQPTAPTVRVYFQGNSGRYLPRAGQWYDAQGLVANHHRPQS